MTLFRTLGLVLACWPSVVLAQWTPLTTGTRASLRGLSVVSDSVVWASGSRGTVIRSVDGGQTWRVDSVPGAGALDLRSIAARSAMVAHVAATTGKIWQTKDGGQTWQVRYAPRDTATFVDALAFWDDAHGIALGDPLDGRFFLLVTDDGGNTWRELPPTERPATHPGEAAFAASGTSLLTDGPGTMWIGSGGSVARLHLTRDGGKHWAVYETGLTQPGGSSGVFAVARVRQTIVAVGGDYARDTVSARTIARLRARDGTPAPAATRGPRGFRSGVAAHENVLVAVGTSGSDISTDGGRTWGAFDTAGYHAVRVSRLGTFFASGSDGRVAVYRRTSTR